MNNLGIEPFGNLFAASTFLTIQSGISEGVLDSGRALKGQVRKRMLDSKRNRECILGDIQKAIRNRVPRSEIDISIQVQCVLLRALGVGDDPAGKDRFKVFEQSGGGQATIEVEIEVS